MRKIISKLKSKSPKREAQRPKGAKTDPRITEDTYSSIWLSSGTHWSETPQ